MTQSVYYCKSWFRAKKKPTEPWSEDKAKAAHRDKLPCTALIGSPEQPYCFLNVADHIVGVGFLDRHLREVLTYAFKEVAAGKLFLTMAIHREFEAGTDRPTSGVTYSFDPGGAVHIRRESFFPHRVETATASFNPAPSFTSWPVFGQYDDLIRVERLPRL